VSCAKQIPTDVGDVDNRVKGSIPLNRSTNWHLGLPHCGEGCGEPWTVGSNPRKAATKGRSQPISFKAGRSLISLKDKARFDPARWLH
jgi:hypothetical protein